MRLITALTLLLSPGVAAAFEGVAPPTAPTPAHEPQLTKAPAVLQFVEADYPREELALGKGAEVGLLIDIDADGLVSRAQISRAASPAFNAAALSALVRFEFSPAEVDGTPAPVRIEYVYHFEPRVAAPPPPEAPPKPKPINLEGTVRERGTRDPLQGASVFLPDSKEVAETDAEGRFSLHGVPAGQVAVEITELKHQKFVTTVEVKEGEVTTLTAYLWKKADSGFEVTVRGEREKHEVSRRTMEKAELTTVPGTFGDPLRVLQSLPGMSRPPYILGVLLVRGSQPQDTGVELDGVSVPLIYHFVGGPSVISPSLIDRIDFYPGAFGAKYGRAIAGIIDVDTKPVEVTRPHGNAKVDLLDAGFYFETPIDEDRRLGSLAIAARRSYIDAILPLVLDRLRSPGQAAIVAAPYYWDYQGRYDVAVGDNKLALTLFGSNDILKVAQSGNTETQAFSLNSAQGFSRARASWSRTTADGWALSLAPMLGTTLTSFDINQELSTATSSFDLGLRGAAKKELVSGLKLELGVDLIHSAYTTKFSTAAQPTDTNPNPPAVTRHQTVTLASYAGYSEVIYSPVSQLKLIPGLRFEMYNLPKGTAPSVEPRAAARYELTAALAIKAGWGIYREAPLPSQLDPLTGNPELGLSMSQQTVAGFEYRLLPKLLLDLQGFYNWRSDLVVRSTGFVVKNGVEVPERLNNSGHGHAYGMELLLKHEVTEHFYGWISYTLSRSEQWDPVKLVYAPVAFDQTHILTLVGSYKWGAWELGARFQLTTGRPQTPILGATLNADTGRYVALTGEPGSARGPTFNQLDLRLEKEWVFELWRFSLYLDVQNVSNAQNPELTLYDYRFRQSAPLRGLPILPTFGLTGAF